MPEAAYDLEYFMPKTTGTVPLKRAPKVETEKKEKSAGRIQLQKTARVLITTISLVALVCAVLYTQTTVAELQSQIDTTKKDLVEAEAYYAYLNFELESMGNIRNVEQRAEELGLVRANSNQIRYVRVEDGAEIEIKENPFTKLLEKARTGFLNIADHLSP